MNTSFKVNGKKSGSSAIAHIERNHSLQKNPTQSISESSNIERPHILIFKKAIRKKIEKPEISRTQISRKIETYKSRLKKYLEELEKLEDQKKIVSKKATILRNEKKIKLLEIQKNLTEKQKTGYAAEFVDIPFSITKCPPENLTKEDFKKLSDIAIETTLKLFNIDKKELGSTAHLDQASAHVHITFNVPDNTNLKDITNMNYREAQIIFNKKIREAFPHLQIDKICSKLNEPNKYLPLSKYKRKCEEKKQQKQFNKVSEKKQSFQEALQKIKPNATNNTEVVAYVSEIKKELINARETILELKASNESLKNDLSVSQSSVSVLEVDYQELKEKFEELEKNFEIKLAEKIQEYKKVKIEKTEPRTTNQEFLEMAERVAKRNHKTTQEQTQNYREFQR